MEKEKLSLDDLKKRSDWKTAVIVFTEDSFNKAYSEEARSYMINSNANYFASNKISSSLFGSCLDKSENGVRLDVYMKALPSDNIGKRWKVDYCYIIE